MPRVMACPYRPQLAAMSEIEIVGLSRRFQGLTSRVRIGSFKWMLLHRGLTGRPICGSA